MVFQILKRTIYIWCGFSCKKKNNRTSMKILRLLALALLPFIFGWIPCEHFNFLGGFQVGDKCRIKFVS